MPWLILVIALLGTPFEVTRAAEPASTTTPSEHTRQEATVRQLVGEALLSRWGYDHLRELCDTVGHRLAGSPAMARAVTWSEGAMREAGLVNVHREPARVPDWTRGPESARIVEPIEKPLTMLGLGRSVSTPTGGITAPVVVVRSYDELNALGTAGVAGRIVLYDFAWTTYSAASEFRTKGTSKAAALGAVGMLVRSATNRSHDTPHTGRLVYDPAQPKIPAASLSVESAGLIRRLTESGADVSVHLEMDHQVGTTRDCWNVIGEVPGSAKPEEIVLINGHLDSWDVGQGAQDDGIGCLMMLEAARLIANLPERPRRTVRVAFFTDEEISGGGTGSYLEHHAAELPLHVAGFESDAGGEVATGFSIDVRGVAVMRDSSGTMVATADTLRSFREAATLRGDILKSLAGWSWALGPLGARKLVAGGVGADLDELTKFGLLGFGVSHPTEADYFDYHHSPADTFDRVDPDKMARNAAILAVAIYLAADAPERLLPWPAQPNAPAYPSGTR
ncbi:MAG TPA: M20/M25/M40 family metallo-hydrolase [Candidatus Eisenbacteria bacterium]